MHRTPIRPLWAQIKEEVMQTIRTIVVIVGGKCHKRRRKPHQLWANIGPFSEQELDPVPNQSVTLKDNQFYVVGPFNEIDAKGVVIGPAQGITGASGDETIVTASDSGDGTFKVTAGLPGQAQSTFTDANGKTMVIDNTVIVGDEAGISGAIGAPQDQ